MPNAVLGHRAFRPLFAGQAVSSLGDRLARSAGVTLVLFSAALAAPAVRNFSPPAVVPAG